MNQAVLNRARNDKFLLILDLPKIFKGKYDNLLKSDFHPDTVQYTCYGSPVPTVSVPAIDIPFGGQVLKASSISRPSYTGLSVPFVVDNGWKNYWILWKWINLFNDQKSGIPVFNYKTKDDSAGPNAVQNSMYDFVTSITTYALDEFNNRIIGFKYTHAFPVSLSDVKLSHQDPSEIICNVSFSFNQVHANLLKDVDDSTCSTVL
jgi:hypothetical protein